MRNDTRVKLLTNPVGEEEVEEGEEEEHYQLWRSLWVESKRVWVVAGPAILTRLSMYVTFIIAQAFIGHIGNIEMAALSIVYHVLVRFSIGVMTGMSNGLGTLCGQAYGAKQYHMLGIYLQRFWLIEFFFCFLLLLPLFIFSAPILKLLGQTEKISEVANIISLWYIPIMISHVFRYTLRMYLQAHGKNMVVTWCGVVTLILQIIGCWILVGGMRLGVAGVMLAMNMASIIPVMGLLIYVFCGGCPLTWSGLSMHAFSDLWPMLKLSISSGIMLCLEIWYNSILILLTGNSKDAEVAIDALSICLNINGWALVLSTGFLAAASVRVSNELGRGSSKAAKLAIVVVVSTAIIIGLLLWALVLAFKDEISYIFSNSLEVANAFSDLCLLLAFSLLLNSIQPVLSGVAVGAGWQSKVVCINIICYYFIGLPLGVLLNYFANLGVKGIWIGMIGGTLAQTLALLYFTYKTNWDKQVSVAKARVNKLVIPLPDD